MVLDCVDYSERYRFINYRCLFKGQVEMSRDQTLSYQQPLAFTKRQVLYDLQECSEPSSSNDSSEGHKRLWIRKFDVWHPPRS